MRKARLAVAVALACIGSQAAAITVDGRFDPSEGYTNGFGLNYTYTLDDDTVVDNPGAELWYGLADPDSTPSATNNVFLFVSQPRNLVDNSWGDHSIGWENSKKKKDSKNGTHKLSDIAGSDKMFLEFFSDADQQGDPVLAITVDPLDKDNLKRLEFGKASEDDNVEGLFGDASDVVKVGTSTDWNLNLSGIKDLTGLNIDLNELSPGTNADGTGEPSDYGDVHEDFSDWVWEIAYELELNGRLFPNGFSVANIGLGIGHSSPHKIQWKGNDSYFGVTDPLTPEGGGLASTSSTVPAPGTLALLLSAGLGAFGFAARRRRR